MSGKTIETGLDAALEATRTNWQHLKTISDEAIDAAIASDADAYALDSEPLGRSGSAYRYEVYRIGEARFGWRLMASDGRVFAASQDDFASKDEALNAISEVRAALLGGRQLAA